MENDGQRTHKKVNGTENKDEHETYKDRTNQRGQSDGRENEYHSESMSEIDMK